MKSKTIYVTGEVGVIPGTDHAREVQEAIKLAAKQSEKIIVLGSLFAEDVPLDAMLTYMDRLDGRLELVAAGSAQSNKERNERSLGHWYRTSRYDKVEHWGMKFQLSPDIFPARVNDGILIHAEHRQDSGLMINARWDAWHNRFGPGGLHSLYALGVLAGQYASGMVAAEPVDS